MLDRKLQPPLKRAYEAELKALKATLTSVYAGRGKLTAGLQHKAQVQALLAQRMPRLNRLLSTQLLDQTRETQAEAVHSLARFMGSIKIDGSLLDDHMTAQKIMQSRRGALNKERKQAAQGMSVAITHNTRQSVQALPEKGTVKDLIDHTLGTLDRQWWQVERTMRTETSRTFNETQDAAFDELQEEFPGLYKRWTELVNDLTGAPLDDRVAQDSLLLHGQLAKPGKLFYMPTDAHTPAAMIGKAWSSPPNRPNDRAVLTPWHEGCGVPAWIMIGGFRKNLR